MGGVAHFGISEGKGGLKHGSRPWLGMDIFWNCPLLAELITTYPFSHKNNYKGLAYTLGSTYMCVYTLSNSSLLVVVTPSRQYN